MKSKYDIKKLHNDCLEWCENPVFPYPWQWKHVFSDNQIFDSEGNVCAVIATRSEQQDVEFMCEFAHLIGLNVESYRIKETYKSAVERYLSTLKEKEPLWEGALLVKWSKDGIIYAFCNHKEIFTLWQDIWNDTEYRCRIAYEFLRLDTLPDYQVDGEGA